MKRFIIVVLCIAAMLLGVSCTHTPDVAAKAGLKDVVVGDTFADVAAKAGLKDMVVGDTFADVMAIDSDAKPKLFGSLYVAGGNPQVQLENGDVQPATVLLYVSYHSTDEGIVRFIYEFHYGGSMQKPEEDKEYYESESTLKIRSIEWGVDPNEDPSVLFESIKQ